jgi:hypothetical protein
MHGKGLLHVRKGIIAEGNWKNNKMDGYGKMVTPDGSNY